MAEYNLGWITGVFGFFIFFKSTITYANWRELYITQKNRYKLKSVFFFFLLM